MNESLEIGKIWTLSTGHLSPDTRKKLTSSGLSTEAVVYPNVYGCFIPVVTKDNWIESPEHYPGELVQIMIYAANAKIDWLHFDASGPRVPIIPYYDED